MTRLATAAFAVMVVACAPIVASAQDNAAASTPDAENAELAKKVNNPIADLVSVPFQFNWQNGIGPNDQTQYLLNVQPVMPFSVTDGLNLIARVIVPYLSQPAVDGAGVAASGVSDILASFFLSPKKGTITWGVGPVISLPATNVPALGSQKWSAGPTAVVLKQTGGWTVGTLANQIWSFAGQTDRSDVSQLFLQPFLVYTTKSLWSLAANSEATANWMAEGRDRWTAPINLMLSKLSTFGPFPASYQFGWGYFFARPVNSATWKVRATVTILLPTKKK